ncbi:hypothetical protein ANCCAN_26518 [Ancylostoma caninum]|uniref:Uncharacterized protein n=1 Tax=Ancylostoma caninum TaxID=29170 RepID=A0A368F6M1_ANCCA|nr:hypothetical protein ANCCAN_26518 [Ancylostoma caninum]
MTSKTPLIGTCPLSARAHRCSGSGEDQEIVVHCPFRRSTVSASIIGLTLRPYTFYIVRICAEFGIHSN